MHPFAEAAHRIIAGGGLYLNGDKMAQPAAGSAPNSPPELTEADLLDNKLAILQVGKGNHVLVAIE